MAVLNIKSLIMTMAVLLVVMFGSTEARTPSCASKLKPCDNNVTSDNQPPAACCDNLREGMEDDFECICTLFATTIPADQAPWLINECGIDSSISLCTSE
ncbi:hypothetical protein Pint_27355 [Pistacia integerrima]|uniref:Uncharacterized protein n=2 Tax=Pistacia TaxID=55512 RepID=A0ACC1BBR2_9ROSI|nr:hypothetical protein Pint_27355 [Pistacia integerrima]KAJ0096350.1 hypothetical protein Patl1_27960 [Pistacia atlantica]